MGNTGAPFNIAYPDPTTTLASDGVEAAIKTVAVGANQGVFALSDANRNVKGPGTGVLGALTTGTDNTATGDHALSSNTSASFSSAYGSAALQNNITGHHLTAIGMNALQANTTGNWSTAVGQGALTLNTTGSENVAIGQGSMGACTTGSFNTALGTSCLQSLVSAQNCTGAGDSCLNFNTVSNSTAFGFKAMFNNTTGTPNTAMGSFALTSNVIGNRLAAFGYQALQNCTNDDNTGLGHGAGAAVSSGFYNTLVGSGAGNLPNGVLANATTTGDSQTIVGYQAGQGSATQRTTSTAIGWQALFDGNYALALGGKTSAGAAGAVAIGTDSGGTGASTVTANEIKLGTANHSTNIVGTASIAKTLTLPLASGATSGALIFSGGTNFWNMGMFAPAEWRLVSGASGALTGTILIRAGDTGGAQLGFFGAAPILRPSAVGSATGYAAGATAAVFHSDDTYTGNVGATGYTINGVVAALKNLGLLAT